jgi:hypothetical protein
VLKEEKERKISFRGTIGKTNEVFPLMNWDKKKKIYTDGTFVYTSLENVYAVLLKNGRLRPLTKLEMDEFSDHGVRHLNVSNMREIYNLQHEQYDSDKSSSDDSSDEKHCEHEIDMKKKLNQREKNLKTKETSDGKNWNQGDVQWDKKYKLYTDDKFVFDGNKKVFGKLDVSVASLGNEHAKIVIPLDIADICMLNEAKVAMVDNFHFNKIDNHIRMSRIHYNFKVEQKSDCESSSSEAEVSEDDKGYPKDLS